MVKQWSGHNTHLYSFSDDEVDSVEKCNPESVNGVPNYYVKYVYRTHDTDRNLKKQTAY